MTKMIAFARFDSSLNYVCTLLFFYAPHITVEYDYECESPKSFYQINHQPFCRCHSACFIFGFTFSQFVYYVVFFRQFFHSITGQILVLFLILLIIVALKLVDSGILCSAHQIKFCLFDIFIEIYIQLCLVCV